MFSFFGKKTWDYNKFPKPWDNNKIALYDFLSNALSNEKQDHFEDMPDLPDNEEFYKGNMPWVAGGFDGCYFMHWQREHAHNDLSDKIFFKMWDIYKRQSQSLKDFSELYSLLMECRALDIVPYIEENMIKNKGEINLSNFMKIALWLVSYSPDREPVKVGLSLFGLTRNEILRKLLMFFALHEEFTLFAAFALADMRENIEEDLWFLAKRVKGWGRIYLVGMLAHTQNEDIKQWMLLEGYKNNVMYDYLAYICANTGDMVAPFV